MDIPLHPALVHFPIALITSAFFFQLFHFFRPYWICRTMSMWLLGLGSMLALAASLTGEREAILAGQVGYNTKVLELIQRHELLGNLTAWGSIIITILWVYFFFKNMEDKRVDLLALAFLGLLSCVVLMTAYLGGTLTFIYGVGIP